MRPGSLRLQSLGDHDLALEILHHVFVKANFGRLLGQRHLINFVLELEERVKQVLRVRRTSNHVNVCRHDLVHALQHGIRVEGTTDGGARTH